MNLFPVIYTRSGTDFEMYKSYVFFVKRQRTDFYVYFFNAATAYFEINSILNNNRYPFRDKFFFSYGINVTIMRTNNNRLEENNPNTFGFSRTFAHPKRRNFYYYLFKKKNGLQIARTPNSKSIHFTRVV